MADQYPKLVFPPYAFGSTYFLGEYLVQYLASKSATLPLYRVEDAGVAIWIQGYNNSKIEQETMDNMFFQANCWNDFAIFVTPVNAAEMEILNENKKAGALCGDSVNPYVLQECVTRRCRCYPIPEGHACDEEIANDEYKDLIPRLL